MLCLLSTCQIQRNQRNLSWKNKDGKFLILQSYLNFLEFSFYFKKYFRYFCRNFGIPLTERAMTNLHQILIHTYFKNVFSSIYMLLLSEQRKKIYCLFHMYENFYIFVVLFHQSVILYWMLVCSSVEIEFMVAWPEKY